MESMLIKTYYRTHKMDASIYRCQKHCNNCPFLDDGKKIGLEPGRVDEIKKALLEDDKETFVCHKTAYDLDENMEPTEPQDRKMCYGAYLYLKKMKRPNLSMKIAYAMGIDGPDND